MPLSSIAQTDDDAWDDDEVSGVLLLLAAV